ncbi:MAG: hypothetical protein ACYCT2_08995 [Thermoplasmataceae archaeon]
MSETFGRMVSQQPSPHHYNIYHVIDDIPLFIGSSLANTPEQAIARFVSTHPEYKDETLVIQPSLFD